jgi:hypothetical protein
VLENDVAPVSASELLERIWQRAELAQENFKTFRAAVARVYVEHHQPRDRARRNADIRVWPAPPPFTNLRFIDRRIV